MGVVGSQNISANTIPAREIEEILRCVGAQGLTCEVVGGARVRHGDAQPNRLQGRRRHPARPLRIHGLRDLLDENAAAIVRVHGQIDT